MKVGNFTDNPLLYLVNETSSYLDNDISDDLLEIKEWDKINPYLTKKYIDTLEPVKSSMFDIGKLTIHGNSVLERAYRYNYKRLIRYTPLDKFKEMLNDIIIEAGVERSFVNYNGQEVEEYKFHDVKEDNKKIIRDGYVLRQPNSIIIPPEMFNRDDMSQVVKRKLNKL